ncbi:hypothetical protein A3K86_21915 [Photobacterium jeanii]|uniref:Uncharacterized protein n=1 Tax=Photobacterium jeanii TaxID=858640 RepID=A0A178K2N8_9GAMM|nr:hypothetical protein [Photobacterium jeanii]OAN11579.1 hypothetical protein A3K86_21915 [Photobacterium jeanii]PST91101.1 hypothetical protein C9I91_11020 [Photobacterium jeanii]
MTAKTLRERLPIGDPRNKVEFLADELEKNTDEFRKLLARLGGVRSWVNNGAFLDYVSDKGVQSEYEGNQLDNTIVGSSTQNGCAIGDGWAFEQSPKNDPNGLSGAFSVRRHLYYHGFSKSIPFECQSLWCTAHNVKGSLYQVIPLPRVKSEYKARVYFSADEGTTLSIGFRFENYGSLQSATCVNTVTTTKSIYDNDSDSPHFSAFDVQTLESEAVSITPSGDNVVVFVEIDPKADMKHVNVHGIELIRSDKHPTWEPESVKHQHDMRGYQRFVDGLDYLCRELNPAEPNVFTFTNRIKGLVLPCVRSFDKHYSMTSFRIGPKTTFDTEGIKLLSVDGDTIKLFIPDNIIAEFGEARFLNVYLNWSAMPLRLGFYQ